MRRGQRTFRSDNTEDRHSCFVLVTVTMSSRVDLAPGDVERRHCAMCDAASVTNSLVVNTQPQYQFHSAVRPPWTPICDQMTSSYGAPRSASPHVVGCEEAAVAAESVYYDVVRPSVDVVRASVDDRERSSALHSQIFGDTRPRLPVRSTAAVVQPYCYLNTVNTAELSPRVAELTPYQRPNVRTAAGRSSASVSLPRPSTSSLPHDNHGYTALRARKTGDVVHGLIGIKSPRRKYLSKSCPDIRLVSMSAASQPRRHVIMSTFGKCRPAVQYDDCCSCSSVDAEKMLSCDSSDVYLDRQDLFSGVDALYPVSEAAALYGSIHGDRRRPPPNHSYQSTYGTLQNTAHNSSRAARVFLSTDRSGKRPTVVCETTRLNSAVCKPIISTRHHKVAICNCFSTSSSII